MVKIKLVLVSLLVLPPLHGMENNSYNRTIIKSCMNPLTRNVLSYGKQLIYASLPLTVGSTSMQNTSMPDMHNASMPDARYQEQIVLDCFMGAIVITLIGIVIAWSYAFRKKVDANCHHNDVNDDAYPTIAPFPLFYDSPHTIDIKKIMHSRTSTPDTDNRLAFGQRYGSGNLHHFFCGCYGDYQREIANTIVLCLQQRLVNMPDRLQVQIPRELVQKIGGHVQDIDCAVLRKLVKAGGNPIYHNPSHDAYRLMNPTSFPWDKTFRKSDRSNHLSLRSSGKNAHEVIKIV